MTSQNSKTSNRSCGSFLDTLAEGAYASIDEGYYKIKPPSETPHRRHDLERCIHRCPKNSIIAEVKFNSPSQGVIQTDLDAAAAAAAMIRGGAVGLSVLTEPRHFGGSLENFAKIRRQANLPLLMKDIVVSRVQIDAASRLGADVVLLIYRLFARDRCESGLEETIGYAHSKGLQVLLEVHDREEFDQAIKTDADLIGVNNRDLETLSIDLSTTIKVLKAVPRHDKTVVSESGVSSAEDIRLLRRAGADAFLVGTSVMKSGDIESKVRELVEAR